MDCFYEGIPTRPTALRPRKPTMDTFAPEFSKFWLADNASDEVGATLVRDDEPADRAALEALAERVSAARSIL